MSNQLIDIDEGLPSGNIDTSKESVRQSHANLIHDAKLMYEFDVSQTLNEHVHDIKTTPAYKKYFLPLSQRITRTYDPDLENARASLEENSKQKNDDGIMQDIDYILGVYKTLLSFDDTIEIYLLLIDIRLKKEVNEDYMGIDATLALLHHIQPYEQQFTFHQKDLFRHYLGNTYYSKAIRDGGKPYYKEAVIAFDKVLNMDRTDTHTGDITERMLDNERYRQILYHKTQSLYALDDCVGTLSTINDFLDACGRDANTHTYTDSKDKKNIGEILLIQGETYETLLAYDKAIKSFRNYLHFQDDQNIKDHIRKLAEASDEE